MNRKMFTKTYIFTVFYVCSMLLTLSAEEAGIGHYLPGSVANLLDAAPAKPGWTLKSVYFHYDGDVDTRLPIAGLVAARVDGKLDGVMAGAFYTFEERVAAAWYSAGLFVPYIGMDVEARINTPLGNRSRHDKENGLGDVIIAPVVMAWEYNYFQFDTLLMIYTPTGDYDKGRLANPGMNHWSFDPIVGVAYNHDKYGFNAAVHTGIIMSTENEETNYRNGHVWHIDASVQQLLPAGKGYAGIGANAFHYEQLTDDNGAGSRIDDFQSKTSGVGPVLSYILPVGDNLLAAEFSWLPELDTEKRLKGDYFWAKVIYQF